jgi:hypothetical protein
MTERRSIWVVHDGDQWAVRREGDGEVISTHSTQEEAHEAARDIARNQEAELVIQGRDGKIIDKDSFGNDPRDIPG